MLCGRKPCTEGGREGFLHATRHAYGAHFQRSGESFCLRQEKAGLGGLKRDGDVGAYSIGAGASCTGVEPGRDIHRQNEVGAKSVEFPHQTGLAFTQFSLKTGAKQAVHRYGRAAGYGVVPLFPLVGRKDGNAKIHGHMEPVRGGSAIVLGGAGADKDRAGPGIQQMARHAEGVAAVIAASGKEQDVCPRKSTAHGVPVLAQAVRGTAGGVFHEDFFRHTEAYGFGIPAGHLFWGRYGYEHHPSRMTMAPAMSRS